MKIKNKMPSRRATVPATHTLHPSNDDQFRHRDRRSVTIIPAGGIGEIGMNWTLYGHGKTWVLVDAGIAFGPKNKPDIRAIYPDPKAFRREGIRVDAILITHAHEDHIGALHRIMGDLNCPIHASPFAAEAIRRRFEEHCPKQVKRVIDLEPGNQLTVGDLTFEPVEVAHTVPGCYAFAIHTKVGTVLHTGDWRFDPAPVIGNGTDEAHLKRLGDKGILAVIGDSTNATSSDAIVGEGHLLEGLSALMSETPGMVVVSCFATNVSRMETVMKAAEASGRYVALAGRSMIRMHEIASDMGLLEGVASPIERYHLSHCDRKQRVVLCTGTQGEPNAALARLAARGQMDGVKILRGDAIAHSARTIPGNEIEVDGLFSLYEMRGATVHKANFKGLPIHATGHATRPELEAFLKLTRPTYLLPVHGEADHLLSHAEIAASLGVIPMSGIEPGSVLTLDTNGFKVTGKLDIPLLAERETDWDTANEIVDWPPIGTTQTLPALPIAV